MSYNFSIEGFWGRKVTAYSIRWLGHSAFEISVGGRVVLFRFRLGSEIRNLTGNTHDLLPLIGAMVTIASVAGAF